MNSLFLLKPYFSSVGKLYSNKDIYKKLVENDAKISKSTLDNYFEYTGTINRYLDDGKENIAKLGAKALTKVCLENQISLDKIDTIIYCAVSKHFYEPSTAAMIAHELNLTHTPVFDVSAACAGMALGVQTAHHILKTNTTIENIALVAVELPFEGIDWHINTEEDLIYKGAGLTLNASISGLIVSRNPSKNCIALENFVTHFDNTYTEICQAPVSASFFSDSAKLLRPSIVAIHKLKRTMKEVYGGKYENSIIIPHQPAKQPIATLAKIMELPAKQVVSVHEKFGNSISGAWISAYDNLLKESENEIQHHQPIAVFTAAGGFVSINFTGTIYKEA